MADPGVDLGREALLRALQQADVAFVLIGGAALQSHGQTHRTDDVDVTPKRSQDNLHRLATVLNALRCKLVIDPSDPLQDVPLPDGYLRRAGFRGDWVWCAPQNAAQAG